MNEVNSDEYIYSVIKYCISEGIRRIRLLKSHILSVYILGSFARDRALYIDGRGVNDIDLLIITDLNSAICKYLIEKFFKNAFVDCLCKHNIDVKVSVGVCHYMELIRELSLAALDLKIYGKHIYGPLDIRKFLLVKSNLIPIAEVARLILNKLISSLSSFINNDHVRAMYELLKVLQIARFLDECLSNPELILRVRVNNIRRYLIALHRCKLNDIKMRLYMKTLQEVIRLLTRDKYKKFVSAAANLLNTSNVNLKERIAILLRYLADSLVITTSLNPFIVFLSIKYIVRAYSMATLWYEFLVTLRKLFSVFKSENAKLRAIALNQIKALIYAWKAYRQPIPRLILTNVSTSVSDDA